MTDFDDIRPYTDEEVRPTLDRVLANSSFKTAMARLTYPRLSRVAPGLVGAAVTWYLKRQLRDVGSVDDLQQVVQGYMDRMINRTVSSLTSSGLNNLDPQKAHLFVSNHRDIAMDPAFLDWVLYENGLQTPRLAIGDNLLTMPYASDLMRLNKSFIVNRSARGNKEKFRALRQLSAYLHHSITVDNSNIWIAQRQGRAKDGVDRTEAAVIKMFAINKPKPQAFADYIRELSIVPVSISYEWDPLDQHKALELYQQQQTGCYEKGEHEDVINIARGIDGIKGHVHMAFGRQMTGDYADADELVAAMDREIIDNYVFHPSNCFAYKAIYGDYPEVKVGSQQIPFDEKTFKAEGHLFAERLRAIDPKYRSLVRHMYANPIVSQLQGLPSPAGDDSGDMAAG